MWVNKFVVPAILAMACLTVSAEDPAPRFDDKIDTWVEGVMMSIDADAGKFSVRGTKRAYASTYCAMLHEIDTKTANMTSDERAKRSAEIRALYKDKLAAAKDAENLRESDFILYLPTKSGRLLVVDETRFYGRPNNEFVSDIQGSQAEKRAMRDLKDLKTGERVVVGFDAGVIYNNVYAVIKIPASPVVPAAFTTQERAADIEPKIASNDEAGPSKADMETTRLVKEKISGDKSLSELARSVLVSTLKGHVTLRGTVANAEEKRAIFNKAALQVGETNVTNELDIK